MVSDGFPIESESAKLIMDLCYILMEAGVVTGPKGLLFWQWKIKIAIMFTASLPLRSLKERGAICFLSNYRHVPS